MRITPLDVRKQEFRKGMRGLDPEEVYAFLATVADEYEAVLNDNKALRERLLELDDKVQEYRALEKTLRDTLLTAERVNVEAKDNARREANIIIKEAQIEAERALRDIKTEAMKLRAQVQQLRSQRDGYLARMKVVAESHLSYIDSAVEDFRHEDAAIEDLDLADEPATDPPPAPRESVESEPTPNLFETAEEVAGEEAEAVSPAPRPAPRVEPANAPAQIPTEPRNAAPSPRQDGGIPGVDPISVIIDRMKKGQQEILATGAGSPGYGVDQHGAPTGPAGDAPAETRETSIRRDPRAGSKVAVASPEPARPLDDTVELKREDVEPPQPGDDRRS